MKTNRKIIIALILLFTIGGIKAQASGNNYTGSEK